MYRYLLISSLLLLGGCKNSGGGDVVVESPSPTYKSVIEVKPQETPQEGAESIENNSTEEDTDKVNDNDEDRIISLDTSDRVESDILKFLSIYDQESYDDAVENLYYTDKFRETHFKESDYSKVWSDKASCPEIEIKSVGVDYNATGSTEFLVVASCSYTSTTGESKFDIYSLQVSYINGKLDSIKY